MGNTCCKVEDEFKINDLQTTWEDKTNKFAFQYLNEFRKENGRSKLEWDDEIFKVTAPHTKMMLSKGKLSHDGYDGREKQLEKSYFVYQSAENVAYYMTGNDQLEHEVAKKLIEQWKKSPGHRKNMLLPDINHVGISIMKTIKTGNNYFYGTQFFVKK